MLSELAILVATFALSAGGTALLMKRRNAPVARLTRALARRYSRHAIARGPHTDLTVRQDGALVTVPTTRLREIASTDQTRLEAELHHTLAEVERAFRWRPLDAEHGALERLVPIPVPVERAERIGPDRRLTLKVDDTLEVAFVVEAPTSEQWLTRADEERLQLDVPHLYRASLARLRERSDGAIILQEGPVGEQIYMVRQGDGLDASRILLEELWAKVGSLSGQSLVLCAPSRDRVYAAPAEQPASIDRMVRHVLADWVGRPHGVSPRLWVFDEGALRPWSTHA